MGSVARVITPEGQRQYILTPLHRLAKRLCPSGVLVFPPTADNGSRREFPRLAQPQSAIALIGLSMY